MAYEIVKSDGTLLLELGIGVTDTSKTSLTLIGKNVANYGEIQNNNFLHLLENFNNFSEPANPLTGQIWYNSNNSQLYVYTGTSFSLLGPMGPAAHATTSTNLENGTIGALPYQESSGSTVFLSIGSTSSILVSSGSAPQWLDPATISINTATNLAGGSTGAIPYQLSVGSTGFLTVGTAGYVLISTGSGIQWQASSALNVGTGTNAQFAVTQVVTDHSTKIATTDFVHNVMPTGVILMWSGSVGSIPTGWKLCDGTSGTPDLRNRFIIGAGGSYNVSSTGGSVTSSIYINSAGSHNHGGASGEHVLTIGQIPAHTHSLNNVLSYPGYPVEQQQKGNPDGPYSSIIYDTGSAGGGGGHSHSLVSDGAHNHIADPISTTPPYYALCYIMKTA